MSPNPNTKYGRKRMRQEAEERIANYTPEEKAEYNKISCLVTAIIFVITTIAMLIKAAAK